MAAALDIVSWIFIVGGVAVFIVGSVTVRRALATGVIAVDEPIGVVIGPIGALSGLVTFIIIDFALIRGINIGTASVHIRDAIATTIFVTKC